MNYQDFYACANNVKQHAEFERYLKEILFNKTEREAFYRRLLALDCDVSKDSFKPYFELYAAERKSNKQDYTPDSIASILSQITNAGQATPTGYTAYDPTAGTGALIINKWWADMTAETIFSYAPHRYFYLCEELADNAIPYLLHNLALRGMNAIVIHGDTLERVAKQIYFIQNSQDDCLMFSDINVMPHSEEVAKDFNIKHWQEPAIKHIESGDVRLSHALPMRRKPLVIQQTKAKPYTPPENCLQLQDIAEVERAKKSKIYRKGSIVIQLSATKGQVGLLTSSGEVGTQYAVVNSLYFDDVYLFYLIKLRLPRHLHRVQEGLNVKFEDVLTMPIG
ncbi:N-6 DNA methylase [Volucribacter amazonae]|uniref:N-6 DNA methylase n=1 Tax=Volucribacter amazonae TaxID=256731 RepID=UPI0024427960|nr:N-6 DNA methylase [Volucribacter amazonae]